MVRAAEIDAHIEKSRKGLMVSKQDVIVSGDGTELGESLLNAKERAMHVRHRYFQNPLNEGRPELPVNHHQQDASAGFARHDEVGLGVPDSLAGVDILGSFVDEGSIGEWARACASSVRTLFPFVPV